MSVDHLQYFESSIAPPGNFPSPFNNQPHALALAAAQHLQHRLPTLTAGIHNFNTTGGGKMLGVLVVSMADGRRAYLSAFSGMLGGRWEVAGFAPVVFNRRQHAQLLQQGQQQLDAIEQEKHQILHSADYLQATGKLASVKQQTERLIADSRKANTERKQARSVLRQQHASDAGFLATLDQQSRDDKRARQHCQREANARLVATEQPVVEFKRALQQLDSRRRRYSAGLQRKLFDQYTINSIGSQSVALRTLFEQKLPPGGAGDCAAVKLLNAAIEADLQPLCLAEFWWGAASGLRKHGRFYPACRSKCRPILPHMLSGLDVQPPDYEHPLSFASHQPAVVYEDNAIVVINKPAGMLSVPGHAIVDSVETRLRKRYPLTTNKTLLLHRLDQPTSGLMVAAKSADTYKHLQHQFQQRRVRKCYLALLAGSGLPPCGEISLPLRVDLDDRPRQLVCHRHGKAALTRYRVLNVTAGTTLVEFQPVTGRTHQLRVHAAHPDGLSAAIIGDELYGEPADRLHLHAQTLEFVHPVTGKAMSFTVPADFADTRLYRQDATC